MFILNLCNALTYTLEQANQLLATSFMEYKAARLHHHEWQDEFVELLAQSRADTHGTLIEAELKQALHIRRQRKSATDVKRMRGKVTCVPTTQIYYTDAAGSTIICSDKASM